MYDQDGYEKLDSRGRPLGQYTGNGREVGQWASANRARREKAIERAEDKGKTWKPRAAPGTNPRNGTYPSVKHYRAICRCLAALKQDDPIPLPTLISYKRSDPADAVSEARFHNKWVHLEMLGMGRFVKAWWPVCQAAYQGGNHDLL